MLSFSFSWGDPIPRCRIETLASARAASSCGECDAFFLALDWVAWLARAMPDSYYRSHMWDSFPATAADSSASVCPVCTTAFGYFNRRHHCRSCMKVRLCVLPARAFLVFIGLPLSLFPHIMTPPPIVDLCLQLMPASAVPRTRAHRRKSHKTLDARAPPTPHIPAHIPTHTLIPGRDARAHSLTRSICTQAYAGPSRLATHARIHIDPHTHTPFSFFPPR